MILQTATLHSALCFIDFLEYLPRFLRKKICVQRKGLLGEPEYILGED